MVSRRTLLAGATTSMTFSPSGCVSAVLSNDDSILNCIEIVSASSTPHTVHLRIDYEGEEVLSDSYHIDGSRENGPHQHRWITQDWPADPGHFRVHTRMESHSEWVTIDCEEESESSAYHIAYWIGSDGNGIPHWETADIDTREQQCNSSLHAGSIMIGNNAARAPWSSTSF